MPEIKQSSGFSKSARPAGPSKPASGKQDVDLLKVFGAVAQTMMENRQALNQADTMNHNHGDNMVAIFETVAKALEQNRGAPPAAQLLQASQALAANQSGSAQLYAGGLAEAARQFQGQKQLTAENVFPLVQALLSGGQAPAAPQGGAADLLGALLGGGGTQPQQGGGVDDLLAALLGGDSPGTASAGQSSAGAELLSALLGGGDAQSSPQMDTAKLVSAGLNIGMAYLAAKQRGSSNAEALIGALINSSPMGQSPHRTRSGTLVADTILSVLGAISQRK